MLGTYNAFLTFYPAVFLAALYGGLGPGLLATGLSMLPAAYFWTPWSGFLALTHPAEWLSLVIFAMSGVMARKCDPSEPLTIYPTALADYSAGMHLVQGILLALLQRERTGIGQSVSVSLYDSMLAMQMQEAAMWLMRDRDFSWGAMPYSGVFATTDGAVVIVGAFKANPLQEISLALDLEDLSADPRFCSLEQSRQNRAALHDILRRHIATASTGHWIARLEARDLLCAPVRSLGEALADPQTAVNNMLVAAEPDQPPNLIGSPVHLSASGFALRHAPPELGQDGEAILTEHGFSAAEIAAFKSEGVLA